MVNSCHFIGRLGRDPETRYTADGKPVCNFSIAISSKYKDKETVEWVNIVAWSKLAEICGEYLTKGKQVYIEGRLQTREWEDRDGNKKRTTEIVAGTMQMLGGKSEGQREETPMGNEPATEDDVPF